MSHKESKRRVTDKCDDDNNDNASIDAQNGHDMDDEVITVDEDQNRYSFMGQVFRYEYAHGKHRNYIHHETG